MTLDLDDGRKDSRRPDDPPGLESSDEAYGLGDIGSTPEVGVFAEYEFGPFFADFSIAKGLKGHQGIYGDAAVGVSTVVEIGNGGFVIGGGPAITFADDTYTNAYFGVNDQQAANSGLTPYKTKGGITSHGLVAILASPITDDFLILGFADYRVLTSDLAQSSIVSTRGSKAEASFGVSVLYEF